MLYYTCWLADAVRRGTDMGGVAEVLAPFPAPLGPGERLWASGPFRISEYRALGDGSWQVGGFVAGGTGAVGMGMLAGSLIGNARAKSRARNQAAANAIPRWVEIDRGTVFVSGHGWHITPLRCSPGRGRR